MTHNQAERFIRVWQRADSLKQVCDKLKLSRATVTKHAQWLRDNGINLKDFRPDFEALAAFAEGISQHRVVARSMGAPPRVWSEQEIEYIKELLPKLGSMRAVARAMNIPQATLIKKIESMVAEGDIPRVCDRCRIRHFEDACPAPQIGVVRTAARR